MMPEDEQQYLMGKTGISFNKGGLSRSRKLRAIE
jgi:hypothetical protein